jgi:hypothetical protein
VRGSDAAANASGVVWRSDRDDDVRYLFGVPRERVSFALPVAPGASAVVFHGDEKVAGAQTWDALDLWPAPAADAHRFGRAWFSGRGPTHAGLQGPLVVAAGNVYIFSAKGQNDGGPQATDFGGAVHADAGTSMATPAISGIVVLVRQYLREQRGAPAPSSYVLRAIVAVTARPIDADRERVNSGYGIPQLARLFAVDFIDVQWIGSRQHISYALEVESETELHVVLSYLDPPLSAAAAYPLFADLDLVVVAPSGVMSRGNDVPGGDAFATNEKVIVGRAK